MNVDDINPSAPAWDALWTFFGAYFHQDFDAEYDDWPSALDDFISGNATSVIERAIEQLESLLTHLRDEDELEAAIIKLGLQYCPDIGDLTYRNWITQMITMLRHA